VFTARYGLGLLNIYVIVARFSISKDNVVLMLEVVQFDRKCPIFAALSSFFVGRPVRPVKYLRNCSPSCSLVFCLLCSLPSPENCSPTSAPEGLLLPHYKVQDMP
jgi:hypothetical protein